MPSEQDTLEQVLRLEQDIKERLDAEHERARQWLEQAKLEADQQALADIAAQAATRDPRQQAAGAATDEAAAAIVRQAVDAAERLNGLTDAELLPFVRRHLAAILPGIA